MSKLVHGVVKVFKKVGKFVLKVAPYVLAAAAVIYTGGAALGLGFAAGGFGAAVGGVVTSLGIGGAVGGALTGAITGAGMGAAVGGILGGSKGLKKGFITGALTGGVLGAVSPGSVGIVKNAAGEWTTKQGIINATNAANKAAGGLGSSTAAAKGAAVDAAKLGADAKNVVGSGGTTAAATTVPPPISSELAGSPAYQATEAAKGLNAGGALGSSAAPSASIPGVSSLPPLPTPTAPALPASPIAPVAPIAPTPLTNGQALTQSLVQAPQAGTGIGGFLNANPALAGNLLTSIGGVLTGGDERATDVVAAQEQAREDQANFAYGGAYTGSPTPFGNANYGAPPPPRVIPRYYFDKATNTVKEIPV